MPRGQRHDRRLRALREIVIACTAMACGLSRRAVTRAGREQPLAVTARQIAMYLVHVVFSVPMHDVGVLFGRDRTTVAHACQRIEERRECPAYDAFMHDLELAVSALASAMEMRLKMQD